MYSTSSNYKEKILQDNIKHVLRIYIDGNKVEDRYILEFKLSNVLLENDEFCLGSTPAKTVTLKIHKNALPKSYSRFYIESGIADEIVPVGYFNVDEISKDDNYTVSLTLIDDMSKFEFNYDGSTLTYPITLMEVLQDICSKAGVELGSTSFLNSDKQVAVYDSTVTARTYLGYIAEQAGGFAVIGRDGKLYIKTIGENTAELDLRYFSEYSLGDEFKVSRVAYEDGINDFKTGNETNNTIWISSDNMYIVDKEQIINIYNLYKNFDVYSFSGTSIVDPSWDIGDILIIDGKKVVYQGDIEYKGKFKASITSEIQAKTKEETTATKISDTAKIRRVQSLIDQINATITLLLQETGEYNEKFVEIQASLDGISQTVESMEDFTREKTQPENLYLNDIAEGEGYVIKFIVYGNSQLFNSKEITICASSNPRGYGNAIYLLTEDEQELLTEDEQQLIIGEGSYYITSLKITLNDVLRNLIEDGVEYCDTLEIEQDGTINVVRKIGVDEYGDLYILSEEQVTTLEEKLVLPSVKNGIYYFLEECGGLKYYAKYITENDYSDTFLPKLELGTQITQNAEAIRVAWNQISQYLQMEGINGKATLNIYDKDNKVLMSLNQDGENFFDSNGNRIGYIGIVREEEQDYLAFAMDIDWKNTNSGKSMAWGYNDKNGNFLPVFYLSGSYGDESSEYGGELQVVGDLSVLRKLILDPEQGSFNIGDFSLYCSQQGENSSIVVLKSNFGYEFYINNNLVFSITEDIISFNTNQGYDLAMNGESVVNILNDYIILNKQFFIYDYNSKQGHVGWPMIGIDSNVYNCSELDGGIGFYINGIVAEPISDRRLKNDFKDIDDKFLDAIEELGIQQFKCDNRNGKISFGIIAQDLIEAFKKYNINPEDYEILKNIKYNINDDNIYYSIEYTQYLILKQLATDKKLKKQQSEIDELKEIVKQQQEQINKLLQDT
jgi:hypothetical protein